MDITTGGRAPPLHEPSHSAPRRVENSHGPTNCNVYALVRSSADGARSPGCSATYVLSAPRINR